MSFRPLSARCRFTRLMSARSDTGIFFPFFIALLLLFRESQRIIPMVSQFQNHEKTFSSAMHALGRRRAPANLRIPRKDSRVCVLPLVVIVHVAPVVHPCDARPPALRFFDAVLHLLLFRRDRPLGFAATTNLQDGSFGPGQTPYSFAMSGFSRSKASAHDLHGISQ